MRSKVTRRRFLKGLAAAAGGTVLAACAPAAAPQVVEKLVVQTVIVEKVVPVEKIEIVEKPVVQKVEVEKIVVETVVVEKPVSVEKKVVETVIVEKPVEKKVVETVVVEREKVVEKLVTAAPAPVGPVELDFLTLLNAPMELIYAKYIPDFEERTGHKVNLNAVGWPTTKKLVPLLAAGTPPDVVGEHTMNCGKLFAQGTYLQLDDIFADSEWVGRVKPALLEAGTFMGKLQQTPAYDGGSASSFGIYRKDFVDEAGMPYPPVFSAFPVPEDMYEWGKKLMKTDASGKVVRWGIDNGPHWGGSWALGGLLDLGVPWFDEAKGEFNLASDELIEVVQRLFIDPIFTHGVQPGEGTGTKFEVKRNARLPEGVVAYQCCISALQMESAAENWGMVEKLGWFENPGLAPGHHHVCFEGIWGNGLPATADPDKRPAAIELCYAPYSPVGARAYVEHGGGDGSAIIGFEDDDPYCLKLVEDVPLARIAADRRKMAGRGEVKFAGWEWGDTILMYELDYPDYQSGDVTAAQACEAYQEKATQVRKDFYGELGFEV